MNKRKIKARVRRGAKLMDKLFPNWHRKTKITKLDMSTGVLVDGCGCVIAQTYGNYIDGVKHMLDEGGLDRSETWIDFTVNHGFTCDKSTEEFPILDEAWQDEIRGRRSKINA